LQFANVNTGIQIRTHATDPYVKITHDLISSTDLCTTLKVNKETVSTVEHLLAVLYGTSSFLIKIYFPASGIDNMSIDVEGNELPIGDGSGMDFLRTIAKMGTVRQRAARKQLIVQKKIEVLYLQVENQLEGSGWRQESVIGTKSIF
jgi:UDP-3-O-acyl-N-acetylglucosamine deacetylase